MSLLQSGLRSVLLEATIQHEVMLSFLPRNNHPVVLGPGLYGPSLFYAAERRFSLLAVCNHWNAGLLAAAGVPVTPLLDTLPQGLVLDLAWRAGAHAP